VLPPAARFGGNLHGRAREASIRSSSVVAGGRSGRLSSCRGPFESTVRAASFVRAVALASLLGSLTACTPVGVIVSATGVATDTSVTWDVVKHIHGKLTENDAVPCVDLNSVQRALNARCTYQPGSIRRADIVRTGLQECPLAVATRDPRLWRALPELLEKGARLDACRARRCSRSPRPTRCPDFAAAPPDVRDAIRSLAETIRGPCVTTSFACCRVRARAPSASTACSSTWLDRGDLQPGKLSFSPLGALDPDLLVSAFGRELESAGHRPEAALDGYEGVLPTGYELAAAQQPLAGDRLVALPLAPARQPRAAATRRAALGAAAEGARRRLPASPGDAARDGPVPDGPRRESGPGVAFRSAPARSRRSRRR
jgi:hypothetical protein